LLLFEKVVEGGRGGEREATKEGLGREASAKQLCRVVISIDIVRYEDMGRES
jgi:hypothetical protein